MPQLKYIGPLRPGVFIPQAEGGFQQVDFDQSVEVDDATAAGLLAQTDNWRVVGGNQSQGDDTSDGLESLTVAVLTDQAQALGIDTKDMKKADLIDAIRAASRKKG